MIISPAQQLFNAIFKASLDLGFDTFDYLPPQSQLLPFVFIGEQMDQDRHTKRKMYGDVQQTIHLYHDYKKRGEITDMMMQLKSKLRESNRTDDFLFTYKEINAQTMIDTSDNMPLLHGIIEVDYTFN